jgi:hypothetical protein
MVRVSAGSSDPACHVTCIDVHADAHHIYVWVRYVA